MQRLERETPHSKRGLAARLNWMMRTAGLSALIASASLLRVYSGESGRGTFSAMMALACVVRSSFSLGVNRLSPLTHLLIRWVLSSVMNIFSPRSVMGMPPAIAIASWHSLMEITGGVRKRFLNSSSSAMMTPRLGRQKFLLLGRKAPVSAHPLFIYDSKVGDEQLLPTQCHGHAQSCHVPATRNLNCPSAITDGSLRHACLPPVVPPGLSVQTERAHAPVAYPPPAFPLKELFPVPALQLSEPSHRQAALSPPKRLGAVACPSVGIIPPQ